MSKITHQNENSDFISHLPEPIFHYIFSLFNNKECARTCVLSKTWKTMYYSRPNMVFHEQDFMPSNSFINSLQGRNLFLDYVDQSLNRSIEMKFVYLESFELHLTLCDPDGIPQSNVVNQLLKKVFGLGVKTMSLMLDSLDNLSHLVLESKTLTQVHLDCFCFIKACKTINFPNLRVLSLFHIDLPNKALKMLISGCPCVEVFRLSHCSTSQNLQLLGLTRLVEITVSFCRDVKTVEIRSLFFQKLYVIDDCIIESTTITLLGCETMSNLHLNLWLSNEFSAFKWLVELKLMNLVIKGTISSQSIKRLVIRHCTAEKEMVEIGCQNLLSLEYEANSMPFHFDCKSDLRDLRYGFSLLQNGRHGQINSLEKLFGSTFNAMKNLKVVILLGPLKEVIILDGLIEVMLSILNKISDLLEPRIFITSDSIDWKTIVLDSYPIVNRLSVNVVSLWGSKFSKDVRKNLLRLKESQTWKYANVCCVQKDYRNKNIPIELQSHHQGSKYQMRRIILEFDWSK